jgi:Putative adhesin
MPTFTTPAPILVTLDLAAGDAHISATERDDTIVEVAPRDASRRADVRAAEQTRIDFADGRLHLRTPRQGLSWGKGGFVEVTIALPTGSRVDGHTGVGELHADGTLADCTFKSGAGAIRLERSGRVQLTCGAGDITVEGAAGDAKLTTGSGAVRIGAIARNAVIKNGNGVTAVGDAGGELRVSASNGDISVERAAGDLVAKTANGNVRVGEVARGTVELGTAHGDIEVGIAQGTAARLDVRTQFGNVGQGLDAAQAPPDTAQTVVVRGRTAYGDIVIERA